MKNSMKNRMFMRMPFWLFIVFVLTSCGGGGGSEGGSCVDISGSWDITETVTANQCTPTDLSTEQHVYTVVQNGCGFTATTDDARTYNGTVSGTRVSWTGSNPSDSGTISVTGTSISASSDGDSMSGTGSWTWSDGPGGYADCSGATQISGTRQPSGPATVDASGDWSGNWSSTTPAHAGLYGSFTASVSQLGSSLTGTISVPGIVSNATLTGSVHGSTITFGDVDGIITFTGTMTGDSASGAYNYLSGYDVGIWSGTLTTSPETTTLSSIVLSPTSTFVAVGNKTAFIATGTYSDATSTVLTVGVDWQSDNPGVATIDGNGLATGVSEGLAVITATLGGVTSDQAALIVTAATTTTVHTLAFPTDFPYSGSVDTSQNYYKVTGLSAGTVYTIKLTGLSDDADLGVYSDAGFSSLVCVSWNGGAADESCNAEASTSGELYLLVDGSYSVSGAIFTLELAAAVIQPLNATIALGSLPYSGSVDTTASYYKLTGLTAGSVYTVSLTSLTDDADLDVYSDAYFSSWLCGSWTVGTFDDELCAATANASGNLYVRVDGFWTNAGATFQLNAALQ